MGNRYFTPRLFAFLRELANNNHRDWFKEHKAEYVANVQEPALDFINEFAGPLKSISTHFVADSRTVGGSLFRIHRDTRFSKDKTPYKTHTGIQFRHFLTRENVHAPGYYLHLEPGNVFVALGMWRPETKHAYEIRDLIAEEPGRWKRAAHGKAFSELYALQGDSLKRPPAGFDTDDPLIDDLKRKDFIASSRLTQGYVTSSTFLDDYTALCKKGSPFMKFLCDAVSVPF
jgi:uncharacterized protein (TIGR02453 family)